jgi:hypothetical protein
MAATLPEPNPARPEPPPLELLGALSSLLVHDIANQMCVISGNATLAQLAGNSPDQIAACLGSIVKASERAVRFLERTGELRRAMAEQVTPGDAADVVLQVTAAFGELSSWSVEIASGLAGPVAVPSAWITFGIRCILAEIEASGGTLYLRRTLNGQAPIPLTPGKAFLEARIEYDAAGPLAMGEVRSQLRNLGLLAVFELVRNSGGKIESFTREGKHQAVTLFVPFVS